jgi:hypothetical protein
MSTIIMILKILSQSLLYYIHPSQFLTTCLVAFLKVGSRWVGNDKFIGDFVKRRTEAQ